MGDYDTPILSNGTLPEVSFQERVEAAAAAGFKSISVFVPDYQRQRAHMPVEAFTEILERNGVGVGEIEVALGFDTGLDSGEPLVEEVAWAPAELELGMNCVDVDAEATIFEMADAFSSHHVLAVGSFGAEIDFDRASKRLGAFSDRCAGHDLKVALEFVPGTNVPDAGLAGRLVVAAARPNLGVCVDSYHHFRGAADAALLSDLPLDKIVSIHVADGTREPTGEMYFLETMTSRLLPGEGDWDLKGFLSILEGADAPVSIEVLSAELYALGAREAATRAAASWDRMVGTAV